MIGAGLVRNFTQQISDVKAAVLAQLAAAAGSTLVSFQASGAGAAVRTLWAVLMDRPLSVKNFGAKGDGATDDTAAINAALATLNAGGALYFPPGSYVVRRGDGTAAADNISADGVTIRGAGAASVILGFKADASTPNDAGNQGYNVFQATGRSGITLRDLSFKGYTTPLALYQCDGVTVDNIRDNALLANAGGYLRDKSLYLHKCSNVRVSNCAFTNNNFAVYLSGDAGQRCASVAIVGNHFEQPAAAGAFTALFPVGVYVYFADDVTITGNTFKNIYSSVDNGSTGTGMGYAVYEGDGAAGQLTITANTFRFDGKAAKLATGVYVNQALDAAITGNVFKETAGGYRCILVDAKVAGCQRTVSGNTLDIGSASCMGINFSAAGANYACRINASGNTINGGFNALRCELPLADYVVAGNLCNGQSQDGIMFNGAAGVPTKFPLVQGNRVTRGQTRGISFNSYCITPIVLGNVVLDGNLSNQAADFGVAVLFSSFSYGSVVRGNTIGNTAAGGGLFTLGVQNASNANSRIFKDIGGPADNTFIGLGNNNEFGRFNTAAPNTGIFDVSKGDFIANVQLNAGGVPGWHCVLTAAPALSADASSASTTLTVSTTAGLAAGDVVLLTKDGNPYDADYYDATKWHADTVQSITDATHLVLTTGIPAGDGTYTAGTAAVRIARFKAAAAIAA